MHYILLFFIGMFLNIPNWLNSEIINQPVVNIYQQPEEDTEVDSQAIYGSLVTIVTYLNNDWIKIKTPDQVEGWIRSAQITNNLSFEQSDHLRSVKN